MANSAEGARRPLSTGFRWVAAFFGRVITTRPKPGAHSRHTLHLMRIRREVICHQIKTARKKHKKAPFDKARSLTHEILRMELGRG